jgi:hypothetical protein
MMGFDWAHATEHRHAHAQLCIFVASNAQQFARLQRGRRQGAPASTLGAFAHAYSDCSGAAPHARESLPSPKLEKPCRQQCLQRQVPAVPCGRRAHGCLGFPFADVYTRISSIGNHPFSAGRPAQPRTRVQDAITTLHGSQLHAPLLAPPLLLRPARPRPFPTRTLVHPPTPARTPAALRGCHGCAGTPGHGMGTKALLIRPSLCWRASCFSLLRRPIHAPRSPCPCTTPGAGLQGGRPARVPAEHDPHSFVFLCNKELCGCSL